MMRLAPFVFMMAFAGVPSVGSLGDEPVGSLSPEGAAWCSLGREPQVDLNSTTKAPEGRHGRPPYAAPSGLKDVRCLDLGLTPQAISFRPSGAKTPADAPASLISLRGTVSLTRALAELQKQAGNPVVDLRPLLGQEAPDPTIDLRLDRAPFWQALDAIAAKSNVRGYPFVDPKTKRTTVGVRGVESGGAPPLVAYSGPFRIAVHRLNAVRDLEKPSLSKLVVTLQLACEPRYEPLLLRTGKEPVRVRLGEGAAQVIEHPGLDRMKLLGEAAVEVSLQLPLPPRGLATLPELQCDFTALVYPERLSLNLEKLARDARAEEKGVSIVLQRIDVDRRSQRTYLHVAVTYPPGTLDLESHQTWAAEGHELVLRSKSGPRELKPVGNPVISVEERGPMRITYTLGEPLTDLDDWRLSYRLPATPVRVPVKFALSDITLP